MLLPSRRVALCLSLFSLALFAQSERGTITGTIRDASGAVVPGAKIVLTNTQTGVAFNAPSSADGEFTVPQLQVGTYNIRVDRQGFRPASLTGIVLNASATVRADITLEVGSSVQAVEVSASALALSTENAKSSVTIDNKLVDELPLVVGGTLRSPFNLAALTPEAKNFGGDNDFAIGGGQAAGYGTSLDGISANTTRALTKSWVAVNAPSIEAITEFTVDTNGFKAEFGQATGGIMSFASKSGTNQIHGSVYEFLRNNALDSNNFFNNARGIARPIYKQHDYGFSAGGPVVIPKLYNGKNKTFFFFSYEAFRNRNGATGAQRTVPTPEMYGGDFRNWVNSAGVRIPIYDPTTQSTVNGVATRAPFPNNQIPPSLFDPNIVQALAAFRSGPVPVPNNGAAPGTVGYVQNNYLVTSGTVVAPNTKISVKGDHVFNAKHRISGYWGYNRSFEKPGAQGPADLPGNFVNYNDTRRPSDVFRGSWDWNISPTIFNHFYGGGNNWKENHDPPQATVLSGIDWKGKYCAINVADCSQNLVNMNFSNGYSQWGGRANNGSENFIKQFANDVTMIKGKHTIKFGGQAMYQYYNGFGRQCISGCMTYDFKNTAGILPNGSVDTNSANGGNPIASMLLGYASDGVAETVRYIGQQWPSYAGFVQTDWRLRPNLMINLGLRWETMLPPSGENDSWSDFNPDKPNPNAGGIKGALIFAGSGTGREGTRTLADTNFMKFGPRFGLAYNMNPKTVIRASAGLSYGNITTVTGSTHQRGFTLTLNFPDQTNGLQPSYLAKNGLPAWSAPPFIDPGFANRDAMPWWQGKEATRPPAFVSWNLSVQRQLSTTMIMEVGYNASLGSGLQSGLLNYNQLDPKYLAQYGATLLNSSVTSPAAIAAGIRLPYPNFADPAGLRGSGGWGGQATVGRSLRPYPQYNAIDTASGGGDHSGHSTYHAALIRFEKRYSNGLQFQTSYVFSKIITDSDSYWVGGAAMDHFNRGLEKSVGQFDIPHNFKVGSVYDLPFGKGKRFLANNKLADWTIGGWRASFIGFYSSGQPLGLGTSNSMPLFSGGLRPIVTTYDNWRAPTKGDKFDPFVDRFVKNACLTATQTDCFFPFQPQNTFGNQTRYNTRLRQFGNFNENISIAKTFAIKEQIRLDFRAEAFNAFNRVRFGTGSLTLQSQQLGQLTGSGDLLNSPRSMQMALKLYF